MKTLIIYSSFHHNNTEKLVKGLANEFTIDLINVKEKPIVDFSDYDYIGFASGIAYGKFYKNLDEYVRKIPKEKKVFFIYTCGNNNKDFSKSVQKTITENGAKFVGSFGCKGFDTYGPFKLIGGLNKSHPDKTDIENLCSFYKEITK